MVNNKADQKRRLKLIDKAYRKSLAALKTDFNGVYDAALRKHGLSITKLQSHFSFPPEFHADIAEAKKDYLAGLRIVQDAKKFSVAQLPRRAAH